MPIFFNLLNVVCGMFHATCHHPRYYSVGRRGNVNPLLARGGDTKKAKKHLSYSGSRREAFSGKENSVQSPYVITATTR